MEVQNDLNGFDETDLFQSTYSLRPIDRTMGTEVEVITTKSPQIVHSMWKEKGFNEYEIGVETNGLSCEGITEIKSHPFGAGDDTFALERLNDTIRQFNRTVDEIGADLRFGPYDPSTGHTAGIHINISYTDDEDLEKLIGMVEYFKPTLILTSNPSDTDNRSRVEAFGYKNETSIAYGSSETSKKKTSDILVKGDKRLLECRIIPMSNDFKTALSMPFLLYKLISWAEGDATEMRKIEYLANNSPNGDSTYTQINRDRVIHGGSNAQVWDAKVLINGDEMKIIPYEIPVSDFMSEHLRRVGDYQQPLFD